MNCTKRPALWFSVAVLVLTVAVFIINPAQGWALDKTVAKTGYGMLQGYVNEETLVWKGVPYAKPPVGALRWKAPENPEPWDGVRDAISPAKKCTQLLTTEEWIRTGVVDPDSGEDCLYVDIYRPQRATYRWEKLPVYVWIHGGSNNFGSARDYDGSVLADRSDVVVVVVQYRLGPIGWFYHPAIQTGGADKLSDSGNFGTLDHAQALQWIQDNIAAFGGNPHNVTITGESAGAHNTMNMVVSPLGKGLFHRAMSESGGMVTVPIGAPPNPTITSGRGQTNDIIEKLLMFQDNITPPVNQATKDLYKQRRIDMENAGTLKAYLSAIDGGMVTVPIGAPPNPTITSGRGQTNDIIEKLLMFQDNIATPVNQATKDLYKQHRIDMENAGTLKAYLSAIDGGTFFLAILKYGSVPTFPAIEDGTVMPTGGWMPTIKAGKHNIVPIILGSNQYESKSFMPLYGPAIKPLGVPSGPYSWFNLINVLRKDIPITVNDVLPTQHDKDIYELTGYYGSQNWTAKFVDTVAHELSKVQDDVYAYRFKWGGIGSGPSPFDFIYGAGHASEIAFFFGSEQGLFGYPFVPANEAGRKDLQSAMMGYLAQFAQTGNPNRLSWCPWWWDRWSHLPYWKKWSNDQGAPKAIVFDADLNDAHIAMMTEELTVEGVTAAFEAAMTSNGLSPLEKAAARIFQFSVPWP